VNGFTNRNLNRITKNDDYDAFLVKFDSNGILLWTKLIGTSGNQRGLGVVIDQNGNIFLIENSMGNLIEVINNCGDDAFLVKYDPNGELLRTKLISSSGDEQGFGLAINKQYIYVTGYFTSPNFHNFSNKGISDVFYI